LKSNIATWILGLRKEGVGTWAAGSTYKEWWSAYIKGWRFPL